MHQHQLIHLLLLPALFLLPAARGETLQEKDLTAEELKKLASVVLSRENKLRSYVVTSSAPLPVPGLELRMQSMVAWKAPDKTLVFADDPADSTPLLTATLEEGAVYDPFLMHVRTRMDDTFPSFVVKLENGDFDHTFGFGSFINQDGTPDLTRQAKIDISLTGPFQNLRDEKVRKLEDGRYVLEALSMTGNTAVTAVIDPRAAIPLIRLELHDGRTRAHFATFTFLGNLPLENDLFDMNLNQLERAGVPLEQDKARLPVAMFKAFMHSFLVRGAALEPAKRPEVGNLLGIRPDWKAVVEADAIASPLLREHFEKAIKLGETARSAGHDVLHP